MNFDEPLVEKHTVVEIQGFPTVCWCGLLKKTVGNIMRKIERLSQLTDQQLEAKFSFESETTDNSNPYIPTRVIRMVQIV